MSSVSLTPCGDNRAMGRAKPTCNASSGGTKMHGDNMAHNVVYLLYMSKEGKKRTIILTNYLECHYSIYDNKNME